MGQPVRIGARGVSMFRTVDYTEDGRILIEPVSETALNRFLVPYPESALAPFEADTELRE